MAETSLPHASRVIKNVLAEDKAVDIGRKRVARNGLFKLDRTREVTYERYLAPGILDPSDFFSRDLSKENIPSGDVPRRGANMARMTWLSQLSGFAGIGRERKHRTFGLGQHANIMPFGSEELSEQEHARNQMAAEASLKGSKLVSPQLSADMDNDIDQFINQQGVDEDFDLGAARATLASPQADFAPATSDEDQLDGCPSPQELPSLQHDADQVSNLKATVQSDHKDFSGDMASAKPAAQADVHRQAFEAYLANGAPVQSSDETCRTLKDAEIKGSSVKTGHPAEEALVQSVHKRPIGLTPGVTGSEDDHPAQCSARPSFKHPREPDPDVQVSGIAPTCIDNGKSILASGEQGVAGNHVHVAPAQPPQSSPSELEPKALRFDDVPIKESPVQEEHRALEPEVQGTTGKQGDNASFHPLRGDAPDAEPPFLNPLNDPKAFPEEGSKGSTSADRALEEHDESPVQSASADPAHEDSSSLKPDLQGPAGFVEEDAEAEQESHSQESTQLPQSQGRQLQGTPKDPKARRTSFAPLPSPLGIVNDAPENDGQVLAERHSAKSDKQKRKHAQRNSLGGFGLAFDENEGVRRSKRIRYGPLQYWKNERPIYQRKHRNLPTIADLALASEEKEWPLVKGREKPINFDELELNEQNFPQRRPALMRISDKRHAM